MKKNKDTFSKPLLTAVAAFAVFCFLGYKAWDSRHSDLFKSEIMKSPEFSFQDRTGRIFSTSELKGKVWVVDFIFAHCAGSCPVLSQQMKKLQIDWKGNQDFKLLSLTVDPERDTAKSLKAYADDLGADENQWFFLTGAKPELYKVIREGFKVTAMNNEEQVPGFDFIHSDRLILVDAKGAVRGLYNGEMPDEMLKLRQDVKFLMSLREKS
jgi:protein SCO1/2